MIFPNRCFGLIAATAFMATLGACVPPPGGPATTGTDHADDGCRPLHEAVMSQADALAKGARTSETGEALSVDRLSASFASLRDCRLAAADDIHGQIAKRAMSADFALTKLNDQKRWFDEEIAVARRAAGASSGDGPAASKAPPPAPTPNATAPYIALARVNVRPGPDLAMAPITMLKKGETVTGTVLAAAGGWRAVTLADGRSGFVNAKFLAPAPATATADAPAPVSSPGGVGPTPSITLTAQLDAAASRAAGAFTLAGVKTN